MLAPVDHGAARERFARGQGGATQDRFDPQRANRLITERLPEPRWPTLPISQSSRSGSDARRSGREVLAVLSAIRMPDRRISKGSMHVVAKRSVWVRRTSLLRAVNFS